MENGKKAAFSKEGIFDPNYLGHGSSDGFRSKPQTGLSKREYFAGLAMQGLLSNSEFIKGGSFDFKGTVERVSSIATNISDALLAELDKPKSE
jgi:hypothetical protein